MQVILELFKKELEKEFIYALNAEKKNEDIKDFILYAMEEKDIVLTLEQKVLIKEYYSLCRLLNDEILHLKNNIVELKNIVSENNENFIIN